MAVLHLATREATICKRSNARNVTGSLSAVTCRHCQKGFEAAVSTAHSEAFEAALQAQFREAVYRIGLGPLWDKLATDGPDSASIRTIRNMLGSVACGLIEMGLLEGDEAGAA